MCVFMCDFILYFNDYVLHLCVINDDDDDDSCHTVFYKL